MAQFAVEAEPGAVDSGRGDALMADVSAVVSALDAGLPRRFRRASGDAFLLVADVEVGDGVGEEVSILVCDMSLLQDPSAPHLQGDDPADRDLA